MARNPSEGLRAIAQLREQLDELESQQVSDALRAGWSWTEIGDALGVSKQAAHRKHAHRPLAPPAPEQSHELLVSANARLAVFMARGEAAARGDSVVDTEHLLLGLIQQGDGGACEVLKTLGVTLQSARVQVDLFFPAGLDDVEAARLPLSRHARVALERATNEVVGRQARKLDTRHLLLAMIREPEARAMQVLTGLGVSAGDVERAVDEFEAEPSSSVAA